MMRNKEKYAIAVRKSDGSIVIKEDIYKGVMAGSPLKKIPFVRGVFAFVDSLILGMRCTDYSATVYAEDDPDAEDSAEAKAKKTQREEAGTDKTGTEKAGSEMTDTGESGTGMAEKEQDGTGEDQKGTGDKTAEMESPAERIMMTLVGLFSFSPGGLYRKSRSALSV